MLGIVFTSLVEMLEEKVSPEFADDVIDEANLDTDGVFTSVGYYPFSEMEKLVTVLVEKTGKSANELLYDFGKYLFERLAEAHGDVIANKGSVFDVLESLDDDIHVQVKKLYSDADLPEFKVLSKDETSMKIRYISKHELYSLAEGLIDATAAHFGTPIKRQTIATDQPHAFDFVISKE